MRTAHCLVLLSTESCIQTPPANLQRQTIKVAVQLEGDLLCLLVQDASHYIVHKTFNVCAAVPSTTSEDPVLLGTTWIEKCQRIPLYIENNEQT